MSREPDYLQTAFFLASDDHHLHLSVLTHALLLFFLLLTLQFAGNKRLPFNHRQKVYPNGTFILTDVDKKLDVGEYKCTAVGEAAAVVGNGGKAAESRAEGSLHLHVSIRPEIDGFVFPKSLQEGQRWNALCSVTKGDPPISIKWYKDGRILGPPSSSSPNVNNANSNNNNRADLTGIHIFHVTPYSSTLNFDSLRPEHRGNYTCQASNHADSVSSTQELTVHGKCFACLRIVMHERTHANISRLTIHPHFAF